MHIPEILSSLAQAVQKAGGRALCVGGSVRDSLLQRPVEDWDVEVYGLPTDTLETLLHAFGPVVYAGKIYGVYRLMAHGIDVSLPRKDVNTGPGHGEVDITVDSHLPFEDAFRRRDLTLNSMGWDPLTGELVDPFGGQQDLAHKTLRATDPLTFGEDPLRALRVAQFIARLEMTPDPALTQLCGSMDLGALSKEPFFGEFEKLLLQSSKPSLGLSFLAETGLLRFFPPLAALQGVPQNPKWHPEGDVWVHTLMVVDRAAAVRFGNRSRDLALMFGALCHDLGKPGTTTLKEGRWISHGHDQAGILPTALLMDQICAGETLKRQVEKLVRWHLSPLSLLKQQSSPAAFRRLARELNHLGLTLEDLYTLTLADHQGRGMNEHTQESLNQLPLFKERAQALGIFTSPPRDCVTASMLMARGIPPGPELGRLLRACQALQDEGPEASPEQLMDQVLRDNPL